MQYVVLRACVCVCVCVAGFMLLKQTPKARNQLKRVQKITYKPEEGEEFERAWLLLTEIHVQVCLCVCVCVSVCVCVCASLSLDLIWLLDA